MTGERAVGYTPHLNPDCRDGKHRACRGDAWCAIEDAPTPCECECHTPQPLNAHHEGVQI